MSLSRKKALAFWCVSAGLVLAAGAGTWRAYRAFQVETDYVEWPRKAKHTWYYLTHPALRQMLGEIADMYDSGVFQTVWNAGRGVLLSKKLYVPIDMGERTGYAYKPGVRKLSFALDVGGGELIEYEVPSTPRTRELLSRLVPAHRAEARYDAHGFRRSELGGAGNLPIVIFLGDSFTDGYYVGDGETFTHYFGKKSVPRGFGFPVNTGVGGYDSFEEYHTLLRALEAYPKTRLVVLDHYANDVATDYDAVARGSVPEAAWEASLRWVRAGAEECRRRKIAFAVAAVPTDGQVRDPGSSRAYQDRLAAFCREEGVPFLDPLDAFRKAGWDKTFLSWDPHFSPGGHRLYAELLWEFTQRLFEGEAAAEPRKGQSEGR